MALVRLRDGPAHDVAQAADQHALRALVEENATLARELGRVQARATQWRADGIAQADRLEAALMQARAACIVKETRLAAMRETLDAWHTRTADWRTPAAPVHGIADLYTPARTSESERQWAGEPAAAVPRLEGDETALLLPKPGEAARAVRRVLCVGGRMRQMPVYRALVERQGGRFAHVDGADPSCLPQLRRALAEADLVILQPGYVCQIACRAVASHCARTGVRCVQLDKACVPGFARSLAQAFMTA